MMLLFASKVYALLFSLQLELRHLINREILIYPGYDPEPGVKYRVFHYGLEFKVGKWSFDKANWRDVDLLNTCWAKFPEPPDASTLYHTDKNLLNRDLLSIECAKTLNEALRLHHVRQNCHVSGTLEGQDKSKEANISTKVGRLERTFSIRKNLDEASPKDGASSTWKLWLIALWIFFGLGFLTVASVIFSGRKVKKARGKGSRSRRRSSYGDDRYIRGSD